VARPLLHLLARALPLPRILGHSAVQHPLRLDLSVPPLLEWLGLQRRAQLRRRRVSALAHPRPARWIHFPDRVRQRDQVAGRLRNRTDGVWADDPHAGDEAGGDELQPYGAGRAAGGSYSCAARGVCGAAAPQLLWVFLVGYGDAVGAGECGLFRWVCGSVVELLLQSDQA
jgi:hypothetical protein